MERTRAGRSPEDRATILIVDDERGPRESLRMILSSSHSVLLASGGVEALEILRSTPVDLATVDLNMPGMLGDELMRTIREEFPHVEVIIITGCGSVESAAEGIRYGISDYLTKPFDVIQVTAAVTRALGRRASRSRLVAFLEGVGEVLGKDRDADQILAGLDQDHLVQHRLREVLCEPALGPGKQGTGTRSEQTVACLEVLAGAIEGRNPGIRGHARRVDFYAGLVAEQLGLEPEEQEQVRIASFLHDLGKVGVPTDAVSSHAALDDAQRRVMEAHPAAGERLIRPLGLPTAVASAIRHHHERWDGSGFPDGLRGEEIPLAARIIAVVDVFDAMTSERPDEPAIGEDAAIAELLKLAGSHFDPNLVAQLESIIESGVDVSSTPSPGDAQ